MNKPFVSIDNSLIIKGGAILLMLLHHLFYNPAQGYLYDDLHLGDSGLGLANQIGVFGKLCVALFVFVSGYGLEVNNVGERVPFMPFYIKRFTKLYFNYWFVWLIFVPIGVWVFNRTFYEAYGSYAVGKSILDFLGLLSLTGQNGYNPTWWFYSCIIVLYLLFPLLHRILSRRWLPVISLCLIVVILSRISFVAPISYYLLPFVVGVLCARVPTAIFDRLTLIDILCSIISLSAVRNFSGNLVCFIDTLLCVGIASFLYKVELVPWIKVIFVQLGKHSQNIFLFHTFIFLYWFQEETYVTRNPLIIFIQLAAVCYLLSVIIELFKQKIGFYSLCAKILIKS